MELLGYNGKKTMSIVERMVHMNIKQVEAGERTMDEIKEMIKNLDDDTMISINFTRFGRNSEEESHE